MRNRERRPHGKGDEKGLLCDDAIPAKYMHLLVFHPFARRVLPVTKRTSGAMRYVQLPSPGSWPCGYNAKHGVKLPTCVFRFSTQLQTQHALLLHHCVPVYTVQVAACYTTRPAVRR